MKRFVVIVLFLSLCVLIGIPSNTIHNEQEGEITLPLKALVESFGLQICDQETISKQSKKKYYRRIKKGIKTFAKIYRQYENNQEQSFEKVQNQCVLPVSIPASYLIEQSKTNLREVTLGDEKLYCLKDGTAGGFVKPQDFYPYTNNIKTYHKTIKSKQKVKKIKHELIKSKRGSRAYKILQRKLRVAVLERKTQKLLISYSEILNEKCKPAVGIKPIVAETFSNKSSMRNSIPIMLHEDDLLGEPPRLTEEEIEELTTLESNRPIDTEEIDGSVQLSGFTIDTNDRNKTLKAYLRYYLASNNIRDLLNWMNWTGNVETCNKGSVSQELLNKTLRRVNYYRAQAGLPSDIYFTAEKNNRALEAALVMAHQGRLSHSPHIVFPDNPCLTEDAVDGALRSNLALGSNGPIAVDRYMVDSGGGNGSVGHRRWILYSRAREMGSGSIPQNFSQIPKPSFYHNASNALLVIGSFKPAQPFQTVAWPNAGYVPYQVVPRVNEFYPRWSFSYPGANFGFTNVQMYRIDGQGSLFPISIIQEPVGNGFGDNTIVWRPSGIPASAPEVDITYRIRITGAIGIPQSVCPQGICEYEVTLFDPYKLNDEVIISGPLTPTTNSNNTYNFTPISEVDSYRLKIGRIGNDIWTEGAETSPTPKIINNTSGGYNFYTTDLVSTGSRAFHLAFPSYRQDENFVIDRLLISDSNSRLEFSHRFRYVSLTTRLSAEISADGGETWEVIWERYGDANSSGGSPFTWERNWNHESIPIPPEYLDQPVLIRFNFEHNNAAFIGTDDSLGAFIDDILLTNSSEYFEESLLSLNGNTTNFNFTPTQADTDYWLQIASEIEGHYFGYGPPLKVRSGQGTQIPIEILSSEPSGTLSTTSTYLQVRVNSQTAICHYHETDVPFNNMTGRFPTVLDIGSNDSNHYKYLTLSPGESHHYYVRCQDNNNPTNETQTATEISFEVEQPLEIIYSEPTGVLPVSTEETLFALTNFPADCRYDDTDISFENMTGRFNNEGTTVHNVDITVEPGKSYNYYIRCQKSDNPNSEIRSVVSFSITPALLQITKQPQPAFITDGLYVVLEVETNWQENELRYQWYHRGSRIDHATTKRIERLGADFVTDEGHYHVVVKRLVNGRIMETVTSDRAYIRFINQERSLEPLGAITPPTQTLQVGETATISIVTDEDPSNYVFWWYKNGRVVYGNYTNTFTIPSVDLDDHRTYYQAAIFRKDDGSATLSTISVLNVAH